jgi:adenylate cyclase
MGTAVGAVLFADLSGFGDFTEACGDDAAADLASRFTALARASLAPRTRLLKTLGDGVLIVAPDLTAARATAHRLRELVRQEPQLLPVRVGLCSGTVVWRDDDVFGAVVNRAARLADVARPWEIREEEHSAHRPTLRLACGPRVAAREMVVHHTE